MKHLRLIALSVLLMLLTACAPQPEAASPPSVPQALPAVQIRLVRAERDVETNLGQDSRAAFTLELDVTNVSDAPIGPLDTLFRAELIIAGAAYASDSVFFANLNGAAFNPLQGHIIPAGQTERLLLRFLVQPRKLLTAPAEVRITLGEDVYLLPLPDAE